MKKIIFTALLSVGIAGPSSAAALVDNFADLNNWTSTHTSYAQVAGNVLSFTNGNSGGDLYSIEAFTSGFISFDYRGAAGATGGGYVGINANTGYGPEQWLAGACQGCYATPFTLDNTGQWIHYSIPFNAANIPGSPASGHIEIEQFANSTPGMAEFRNFSVSAVPEPGTYAMLLAGLGMLGLARRRKAA